MNILLIEDTKSHSDFITSILVKSNHNVKLLIDGNQAFNYLLKPDVYPDIVIADNFLPEMTGLEIIDFFVKNNYNYAFIILTSGVSIDLAVKGMKVGALEYISKSIDLKEQLQLTIEKAYKTNQEIILRKKLEKNLKESEGRLKRQYQNLPFPTYSWKKTEDDFVLVDYNLAAIEISQGGIKKFTGAKLNEMFANYPVILKKTLECYNTHKNQITENNYIFQTSGIKRYLKSSYIYVPDDLVMVHTEDITERMKAEKALRKSEKKLKNLNTTKDKFFSIIAHDLKSPFTTMLGFSELLIKNFTKYDTQKQKEYLGILNQDIKRTYKLLENLLLWSQAQKGTIDFKPENTKLNFLLLDTLELLRQSAVSKSIKIINNVPEDIRVKADQNMLFTIFRNLISNAIKFTPEGGTVEIGCRHVETYGRTSLRTNTFLEIYVKDSGVGIAKEKISHLFDISENISTKGTGGETGTGLGLTLCKEFVEKHGGKIWLESEKGKGSEFIFTLETAH